MAPLLFSFLLRFNALIQLVLFEKPYYSIINNSLSAIIRHSF